MDTNGLNNGGMNPMAGAAPIPEQAVTREETDKKCPSCGGIMQFAPAEGMLYCPYCEHKEEIKVNDEQFVAEELDFDDAEEEASCDWGVATKSIICKSCGAETIYDVNDMSSKCPYCGSNQVMEDPNSKKVMAPGGVVPFKLDAAAASKRFKDWIGRKFFCPKLAKESAKPDAFTGIYIPYWTFDSQTESDFSGEYGTEHHYRDSKGNTHTKINWHPTSGHHSRFIDDMLVCASSKQSGPIITGLEPYDTKLTVEYKPEYMAGFKAERYTIKMKDAWETGKQKIDALLKGEIKEKIRSRYHTSHARVNRLITSHNNITYKYLLLPVWISAFKYQDKVYQFMVNGQTGKVSGKTPISWIKVGLVALGVIAVFVLIYMNSN